MTVALWGEGAKMAGVEAQEWKGRPSTRPLPRAFSIAARRAAFCFRRRLALGFSNRRGSRNCFSVCSRSSLFFSRRVARAALFQA